jgi:eukaryotic-like serine/threonine-protein kinase
MTLSPGTRLGPYELVAPVGAGGMGEVYRAKDTRLDRTVAVKVLPSHLSASAESRQRFEREAKTISQLSHPHICALYDVGREGETEYLVMEYLEGETLSDRLLKGPLAFEQVFRYGIEIADALDKAHRQGIVHRDLKPGNVMLTKSGVKLLDFGLAKAIAPTGRSSGSSLTALPTQAGSNLTQEGTILGTFQYMAPEQLEGKEADARTDIFAFGAVLYEMATGRKAFSGKSQASLISSIMGSEPPAVSTIAPMTPPAFDRVVRTCLAKDPDDRWQTAHDVMLELKWVAEGGSAAGVLAPVVAKRKTRERLAWGAAALFASMAAAATIGYVSRGPKAVLPTRVSILPPEGTTFSPMDGPVVLSPDGRRVAFAADDSEGIGALWVRSLDSLQAQKLEGTGSAYDPFWSPDGRFVGFGSSELKKVEVSGGPPQTICEMTDGRGGTWNRDNVVLFAKTGASPIFRVPAGGGVPEQVTVLDKSRQETGHWRPQFFPDGKHFLYLAKSAQPQLSGIYVGSLDSKERSRVADVDATTFYGAPGYLLFVRERTLLAQPFDIRRFKLTGDPIPVARDVSYVTTWGAAAFWASESGALAYQSPGQLARRLMWYDRTGKPLQQLGSDGEYRNDPRISPDGTRLAISRLDPETRSPDIWILEIARGSASRLTYDPSRDAAPIWSPDGSQIVFTSNRNGVSNLFQKPSSGGGTEELLLPSELTCEPQDWSPDGRYILYRVDEPKRKNDLWLLPLTGEKKPTVFLATPFREQDGRFSPDGKWVTYSSDETGRLEVYVQPFPATGAKWQISSKGGNSPRWASAGKEIIYYEPASASRQVVEIRTTPTFHASVPKMLFPNPGVAGSDVPPDGQRLLLNMPSEETKPSVMTLVFDWTAGLKK